MEDLQLHGDDVYFTLEDGAPQRDSKVIIFLNLFNLGFNCG